MSVVPARRMSSQVVDLAKGVLQEMFWNKVKLVTAYQWPWRWREGALAWANRPVPGPKSSE